MPIKITCPHCSHAHLFSQPYPLPGSEVQCDCGRVLVISFPPDMMSRLEAGGAIFTDTDGPRDAGAPYQPAPTPALPPRRHPAPAGSDPQGGS
jgi:hypothetical protein